MKKINSILHHREKHGISSEGEYIMEKDKDAIRIIEEAYEAMKEEGSSSYREGKPNIAELSRRTGLSRKVIQRLVSNGLEAKPHGNSGEKGYRAFDARQEELAEALMRSGVSNSAVILSRLKEIGYTGSGSTVKRYIRNHKDILPSQRELHAQKDRKIRRYETGPGEMYQMDWGFVKVEDTAGITYRCACFAMVCHHCGFRFMEFFPNAKQESLFIGMLHAFSVMGVPETVLTDNMASVSNRRDMEGNPVFNAEYDGFQQLVGIRTKLCKPRHPWTKGSVERLVKYIKDNFVQSRTFINITDLNEKALSWCMEKNMEPQDGLGVVPSESHRKEPLGMLPEDRLLLPYLAPKRSITNDGFVWYEGRRYGVPLSLPGKTARVLRNRDVLYIMDPVTYIVVETYHMDWSKRPHYSPSQFEPAVPEEHPTAPVKSMMRAIVADDYDDFSGFDF